MLNMRRIDSPDTINSEETWSRSLLQFRIPHSWTANMDAEIIFDEVDDILEYSEGQEHENNVLRHLPVDVEASHSLPHDSTMFH